MDTLISKLEKKQSKLKSMFNNKGGVLGLNTAAAFFIGMLTLAVIGVAVLLAISQLNQTSIATNATIDIGNNVSAGVSAFFDNSVTFFVMLGVAVLILIIALVILATRGLGATGATGGGL